MTHKINCRIYYEDTDAGGVVFYANYLKFCERGRTELLRAAGFENRALMDKNNVIFVVRHLEADYMKPAHLDDLLTVTTSVTEIRRASFAMHQAISRGHESLFAMTVTLVCVNNEGKPVKIPADIEAALEKHD